MIAAYAPLSTSVTMTTANTEYSYTLTHGDREVLLRLLDTSVAWRVSWTAGEVAGGGGMPMKAGEAFEVTGPLVASTIYFASSSAAQSMKIAKLRS